MFILYSSLKNLEGIAKPYFKHPCMQTAESSWGSLKELTPLVLLQLWEWEKSMWWEETKIKYCSPQLILTMYLHICGQLFTTESRGIPSPAVIQMLQQHCSPGKPSHKRSQDHSATSELLIQQSKSSVITSDGSSTYCCTYSIHKI